MLDLKNLAQQLARGEQTSEALLLQCFEKINDTNGEGARTFIRFFEHEALAAARVVDSAREAGRSLSPYAGIPISVKDVFDVQGSVTRAGSTLLSDQPPATQDATVVTRLRQAGFILVGATNMTEFAYSGLGINPHYGTPLNPFERSVQRIPGGSSSGAAVAVSDGFTCASIGTDTGGSCRIPAALCGLVGYKPTAARIPCDGVYPLSPSLDSVGVIAQSVQTCAVLADVMAGREPLAALPRQTASFDPSRLNIFFNQSALRVAIPASFGLAGMDVQVKTAFENAVAALQTQGLNIETLALPELNNLPDINRHGGFAAYESYQHHSDDLQKRPEQFDPRVRARIETGEGQTAEDYQTLKTARAKVQQQVAESMRSVDALLLPTVPIIAPTLAELDDEEHYFKSNALILRNPSLANFIDGCSISVPCHAQGQAPVGLMLIAAAGKDERLLVLAGVLEEVLVGVRGY